MERGKNTKGGRTCSTRCQDFQQSNNYEWYWYRQTNQWGKNLDNPGMNPCTYGH